MQCPHGLGKLMLRKVCHDLPEEARQSLADLQLIGFKMMLTPVFHRRGTAWPQASTPWIPLERKD